ncbi:MAG: FAD-binding protein [bacterium]|nr:FAD-binding protein [bacterium]
MIKTTDKQENKITKAFEKILGKENILTSKEDRIMYATDSTAVSTDLYLPDYVLMPQTTQQISEIMKIAYKYAIPVTTRGAGTNMAGACVPFKGGIVICTNKMNNILDFDIQNQTIKVQTGVIVGDMQAFVEKNGLFYPPDPSNLKVSTIGGSLAMSSSGSRTFKYGGTKDYVLDLTVVLSTGEIIKTGSNTIKNATGYNLTQLFVGSEGTLGIITEATFRLIPKPENTNLLLAYFKTVDNAANAINSIILNKIVPSVLDIMDEITMKTIEKYAPAGLLTDNAATLFIEVDGDENAIEKQIQQIKSICRDFNSTEIQIASTEEEKTKLWAARRSSFGAVAKLRPNVLSEDMVVPRSKMPMMIERTYEIAEKYNLNISIVGHAGDGNFHPHIAFDLRDKEETQRVNKAIKELFLQAINFGGKISGEHGIGSVKAKYLKYSVDTFALKYMKQIKNLFDAKGIMNPNKVFDYEIE